MEEGQNPFADRTSSNVTSRTVDKVSETRPPDKKSRKKLALILFGVGGFIILCVVAFLIWWFAYYNNDKAILSGAFDKLLTTKSSDVNLHFKLKPNNSSGEMVVELNVAGNRESVRGDVTLSLTPSGNRLSISRLSISGAMFYQPNGDLYIKISNLTPLIKSIASLQAMQYSAASTDESQAIGDALSKIATKVDDRWVKISAADLKSLTNNSTVSGMSEVNALQKCMTDLGDTVQSDKSVRTDLLEAIQNSNFLGVKRVGKDQNGVQYELTINAGNVKALVQNITSTKVAKQLESCAKNAGLPFSLTNDFATTSAGDTLKNTDLKIYFWVDRGSREPRRAEIDLKEADNGDTQLNITMTANYRPQVLIAPSRSTDIKSLMNDLQMIFQTTSDSKAI